MSLPNLSFQGGAADSGVEGNQRQSGAWHGGPRTKVVNFTGSGTALAGAAAGGAGAMPSWMWWVLAAAAAGVGVILWRRR